MKTVDPRKKVFEASIGGKSSITCKTSKINGHLVLARQVAGPAGGLIRSDREIF